MIKEPLITKSSAFSFNANKNDKYCDKMTLAEYLELKNLQRKI